MKRSFVVVVVVAAFFFVAACGKTEEKKTEPTKTQTATPPPLPATQAIYAAYASAPSTFNRVPHLSRFAIEENRRIDGACARGEQLPACNGDRFACLALPPTKPGTVKSAVVAGEQPGVSASIKLELQFGDVVGAVHADVVWEDGEWKIDQVQCAGAQP